MLRSAGCTGTRHSRRGASALAIGLLGGALVLGAAAAPAGAGGPVPPPPECRFVQVTRTVGATILHVRASHDGERAVFLSPNDLVGANPDGSREIFETSLNTGAITQLTHEPGGTTFNHLSASDDLSVLAYTSNRTDAGNTTGADAVFVSDRSAGTIERLTTPTNAGLEGTDLDGAGTRVVFRASGAIGAENPDGSLEGWLHDRDTGTTTAITDTSADHLWYQAPMELAISTDGAVVVYVAATDEVGENADGNREAFRYLVDGAQRSQLTHTTTTNPSRGVHDLAIDGDGDAVAVNSVVSLEGEPYDDNEAFLTVLGPGPDDLWLAWSSGGDEAAVNTMGIDDAGQRLAWGPNTLDGADPPAADQSQYVSRPVLVAEVGGEPQVLSWETNSVSSVQMSGDGDRVVWEMRTNPLGQNPDDANEVWMGDCRTFRDVASSHPFSEDVEWLAAEGIATGYADGGFHPASVVSRQAAAAFLYRLAGEPELEAPAEPTFDDVPTDHPFSTEIEWAAAEEITGGYPDGGFHPAADVTRQAFAAFLHRLAGEPEIELPEPPTFADVPGDHPFVTEIEWAADVGITGGYPDGGFHPASVVTRQATAAFLHRFADGPGTNV